MTTGAERSGGADLVAIARALRRAGAPVTVDDVRDAARGLERLGSTDHELIQAVLAATLGKYGVLHDRDDTRLEFLAGEIDPDPEVMASPATARDAAEGGEVSPQLPVSGAAAAPRSQLHHEHGEQVTLGATPDAVSLGPQTEHPGSAHEAAIGLLDPPGGAAGHAGPSAVPAAPLGTARPTPRWSPPAHVRVEQVAAPGEIVAVVRPMLRRWNGAASRPRPRRGGRVDVHRSVRRALRSRGSLLPPARRRPARRRPAAVVVVDLSPSVRGHTSVAVSVAHALARSGRGVRVFAATDRLSEVTSAFRRRDVLAALGRSVAAGTLDPTASSDWGRVLTELDRRVAAGAVRRHVVVLGDGRSVGSRPGSESLQRIVARAGSVRWATPEPRAAWALGSGEPEGYAAIVDHMVTLRTAADVVALVGDRNHARTK